MAQSPLTLVLGASENPNRYSHRAANMLKSHGHAVWLTGRRPGNHDGMPICTHFPEQGIVDTVTLYVGPAHQAEFASAVEKLLPRRIIFNPGTENPKWQAHLQGLGIVVEEACTLVLLSIGQY
jgi:hypothetical protein